MKIMVKRNLKIYFQDKAAVFFSMLSVIIIFALYIFFIGDSISSGLKFLPHPNRLMRAWMLAGMLASASIFTLIFGEIYMGMIGGAVLDMDILLKLFGVIVLSAFASSAIASFIISFLKTNSAYSAASMIVGTLIGFLVGAYIPIGNLPENVQWLVKYFPCAHSAVLYRQLLMKGSIKENFANQPTAVLKETKEILGVVFVYNGHTASAWMSVVALLITGVVFYLLAVLVLIRKENEI